MYLFKYKYKIKWEIAIFQSKIEKYKKIQYSNVATSVIVDLSERKCKNSFIKKIDINSTRKNLITLSDKKVNNKENNKNKEDKEFKIKNFNLEDNFITLKTNKYNNNISIIEVKLPNPYLDSDLLERNKTIEYHINSKFKSPYADYLNHSLTHQTFKYKSKLNHNKMINLNKFNNRIHFTKTNHDIYINNK